MTKKEMVAGGEMEKLPMFLEKACGAWHRILSENSLRNRKYHFSVIAAMVAMHCIDTGLSADEAYLIADIYSRKADVLHGEEEIEGLLEEMCMDFAERMQEIRKEKSE